MGIVFVNKQTYELTLVTHFNNVQEKPHFVKAARYVRKSLTNPSLSKFLILCILIILILETNSFKLLKNYRNFF